MIFFVDILLKCSKFSIRNGIEFKFGEVKRKYDIGVVKARTNEHK